ncbi:DUF6266 family protein [Pedobacter gandavensis]|uniref:DUF6266 family protein n=1 Tax=Pedobacter gandavensis TaxID=2679963 RepID=UPI00292EBFDF|nr:DUF6266 family protein [Pedobacter gandavensis]
MGTIKNGRHHGKVGKTVTYMLNGKLVTRSIGKSDKPATDLQKAIRLRTKVTSKFLLTLKEFILVGYEADARRIKQHPINQAFRYHWKHASTGNYPKIKIDFPKVLLSYGSMPLPKKVVISVVEKGFNFSWGSQKGLTGTHWSDQVMLVAYFPTLKRAAYKTAGATRDQGTDLLPIFDILHGVVAETYIAFISNDRKTISNSVYTGRVTW